MRAGVLYASGQGVKSRIPYHAHKGSISQRVLGVIGVSTGRTLIESLLGRGFDSLHLHPPGKHKSKVLDNNMRSISEWEKRNRKRKELRNALLLAPFILILTAVGVISFIKLLQHCGIL